MNPLQRGDTAIFKDLDVPACECAWHWTFFAVVIMTNRVLAVHNRLTV